MMQLRREGLCRLSGEICFTCSRKPASKETGLSNLGLFATSSNKSELDETDSAQEGNFLGDETEVSKGRSSQMPIVMDGTR
jgi:hypothetical protein